MKASAKKPVFGVQVNKERPVSDFYSEFTIILLKHYSWTKASGFCKTPGERAENKNETYERRPTGWDVRECGWRWGNRKKLTLLLIARHEKTGPDVFCTFLKHMFRSFGLFLKCNTLFHYSISIQPSARGTTEEIVDHAEEDEIVETDQKLDAYAVRMALGLQFFLEFYWHRLTHVCLTIKVWMLLNILHSDAEVLVISSRALLRSLGLCLSFFSKFQKAQPWRNDELFTTCLMIEELIRNYSKLPANWLTTLANFIISSDRKQIAHFRPTSPLVTAAKRVDRYSPRSSDWRSNHWSQASLSAIFGTLAPIKL